MEELYLEEARKLARKDNPKTSKDAAEKMVISGELNRQEVMVYEAIKKYNSHANQLPEYGDFTTKDIAGWLTGYWLYDKAYDICRKRFSGLRDKGKIERIFIRYEEKTGKYIYKRRDGCRVWRLK